MSTMCIDAPRVLTRADFRIERGALGVAYFVRGPYFGRGDTPVALDYDRAEAIIATLVREDQARAIHPDVMF